MGLWSWAKEAIKGSVRAWGFTFVEHYDGDGSMRCSINLAYPAVTIRDGTWNCLPNLEWLQRDRRAVKNDQGCHRQNWQTR